VAVGAVDTNPAEPASGRVAFRPSRVDRLIGTTGSTQDQVDILERVGIAAEAAPAETRVLVATAPQPLEIDPGDTETLVRHDPHLAAATL
jgi:phenylalanyl-tRNA synthetase beta subunit